ncbi:MAG: glycerol kinase GlpK [Clostridiales bacterium]|nr:glycerol kinase GlpK [Clostridiales bacterium]
MAERYILALDQSTQGTKALVLDARGRVIAKRSKSHRQIIDDRGWVEHDPDEIYRHVLAVLREAVELAGIEKGSIAALGISNQRETALAWDRESGKPVYNAVGWQCARGEAICRRIRERGQAEVVKQITGLPLSPYFSAAKLAWILENVPGAGEKARAGKLCCGTVDSWLVYRLTGGRRFRTDASNASRTQLFDIRALTWSRQICALFAIAPECLPEVTDSNGDFGSTDLGGFLDTPIPIRGVLGDSHAALFGQDCRRPGRIKATYGTGSSVMMHTGGTPAESGDLATSLAWMTGGKAEYVLEGNINYTGAVITWLKDDLNLISSVAEGRELPPLANEEDASYFVPAFTGLGAPHWDSKATGLFTGITRCTGRAEMVRAAVDSIAYQITDIIEVMRRDSGIGLQELRVDGGPTENRYLMQFQSDMAGLPLHVPEFQELSAFGGAVMAGLACGACDESVYQTPALTSFHPRMEAAKRQALYAGWQRAVGQALAHS